MTVTDIDTPAPDVGSVRGSADEGGPAGGTTCGPLTVAKGLFRDTREDALADADELDDAALRRTARGDVARRRVRERRPVPERVDVRLQVRDRPAGTVQLGLLRGHATPPLPVRVHRTP